MKPLSSLLIVATAITAISTSAYAATQDPLTRLPVYPGSSPVSTQTVDTTMKYCSYNVQVKGYHLPDGSVTKSLPWYLHQIPGSRPYAYHAGPNVGNAIFNADGSAEAVIQKSPNERFIPATLMLYRFSPAIPPASRANIANASGC